MSQRKRGRPRIADREGTMLSVRLDSTTHSKLQELSEEWKCASLSEAIRRSIESANAQKPTAISRNLNADMLIDAGKDARFVVEVVMGNMSLSKKELLERLALGLGHEALAINPYFVTLPDCGLHEARELRERRVFLFTTDPPHFVVGQVVIRPDLSVSVRIDRNREVEVTTDRPAVVLGEVL